AVWRSRAWAARACARSAHRRAISPGGLAVRGRRGMSGVHAIEHRLHLLAGGDHVHLVRGAHAHRPLVGLLVLGARAEGEEKREQCPAQVHPPTTSSSTSCSTCSPSIRALTFMV